MNIIWRYVGTLSWRPSHFACARFQGQRDEKVCSRLKAAAYVWTYSALRCEIFMCVKSKLAWDSEGCGLNSVGAAERRRRRGLDWKHWQPEKSRVEGERESDRHGHKRGEKKGSCRKGMKGNVRERGNGRLEGNRASVKQSKREGAQEGGSDLFGSDGVNICWIPPILCQGADQSRASALWTNHREPAETSLQSNMDAAEGAEEDTLTVF